MVLLCPRDMSSEAGDMLSAWPTLRGGGWVSRGQKHSLSLERSPGPDTGLEPAPSSSDGTCYDCRAPCLSLQARLQQPRHIDDQRQLPDGGHGRRPRLDAHRHLRDVLVHVVGAAAGQGRVGPRPPRPADGPRPAGPQRCWPGRRSPITAVVPGVQVCSGSKAVPHPTPRAMHPGSVRVCVGALLRSLRLRGSG